MATRALLPNRRDNGQAIASPSTGRRRPHYVRRTDSSRHSQRSVAEKIAEALTNYSEGEIAVVADCSKDTAQSWKLGRRAANTSYTLRLATMIDEVGMLLAEEADLGRFYGHDGRIKKILQEKALHETPEGRFAREILREIGTQ